MPKPNGIAIEVGERGPSLSVRTPQPWMDKLWDTVQEAQARGVTAKQFKNEVKQAWKEGRERDLEMEMHTFNE